MLWLKKFGRGQLMASAATIVALGAILVACATPTLTPAPSADRPSGEERVAIDEVNGIRARVDADAWSADPTIGDQLTPLHVEIHNSSDMPVRIRYQEFALIGPQGQYFSALPPLAAVVDMDDAPRRTAGVHEPIANPAFRHRGFSVAPPYGYAYGDIPVWQGGFHHDSAYHDTYYGSYRDLDLSVAELRTLALPEGVIEPNGSVSGFIYFERVDPSLPRVQFRADLVNAESGRTVGTLSIPFDVNN